MEIRGKIIDDRIIDFISRKNMFKSSIELEKFFFPDKNNFLNPFDLKNMQSVVSRINLAIKNRENILIYGDYDCDGICSSTMLYMFLKTRGIDSHVFIPDRFEDGYGMSDSSIEKITTIIKDGLIITVDCGISCVDQINKLKNLGYDVIVTDHHEPANIIPNCLIIDPKLKDQNYTFDGLSGAGVVFKLIHAMSNLDIAMSYIDICAISTVGDIVPLVSENRIITYYGLKMLNSDNTKPFIKYLKTRLNIDEIDSTELSFKIVPRINASGRMDNSDKCFEFFIANDEESLKKQYDLIDRDNELRLKESTKSFIKINEYIKNSDFNEGPAIFVYDKEINLGIIGIIASKLCAQYKRPVFIFSDSETGNLKGSVRSVNGINIFDVMSLFKDLLIDIGGHELAGGLTVSRENFELFKSKIQNYLKDNFSEDLYTENDEPDIIITEKDLNLKFVEQLEMLEPFGHKNKRPLCLLTNNHFEYNQMKSFAHYKVITYNKREIISFFGYKYMMLFNSNCDKKLTIELSHDNFLGKKKVKAILKNATGDIAKIDNEYNITKIKNLYYSYLSMNTKSSLKYKYVKSIDDLDFKIKNYGTLFIADNYNTYEKYKNLLNIESGTAPDICGRTIIMYNPFYVLDKNTILLYKNVVFLNSESYNNEYNFLDKNIYILGNEKINKAKQLSRDEFASIYKLIRPITSISSNNFLDLTLSIKNRFKNLNEIGIAFFLVVSAELGFIKLDISSEKIDYSILHTTQKQNLYDSKFYK